ASWCRLVKGSKAAGGNRLGTAGKKMGQAHRKGAFADAAPLLVRHNLQGQQLLARLEKKHDQGKALSILAHTLGRAVYGLLTRQGALEMDMFLQPAGSRAGAPGASRDLKGLSLPRARSRSDLTASVNAKACRGRLSLRPGD